MSYEPNNTGLQYQQIMLDEVREREIFSMFPLWVVNDLFVWTGKWFKHVRIKEQKYKVRYSIFDDGWSYMNYWGNWKYGWEFLEIVKERD